MKREAYEETQKVSPSTEMPEGLTFTIRLYSIWWRGMDLNHGPSGYAYHYSFHCRTQTHRISKMWL